MTISANKSDYSTADDRNILLIIKKSWSNILHLSERTLQRYKKEKIDLSPIYSEKVLEITLLFNKGVEVFGELENFNHLLNSKNISLGGVKPITLLDNTFGIMLLKDQLIRIEHGVLA